MGEDEVTVQINGGLVVLGRVGELGQDEVELSAVVEDVRITVVLGERELEVL